MAAIVEKTSSAVEAGAGSTRLLSIDVLRGLTILVMMFVNDLEGVRGAPAWMKHVQPSTADGMTFVDVVFPAFLFIAESLGRFECKDSFPGFSRSDDGEGLPSV